MKTVIRYGIICGLLIFPFSLPAADKLHYEGSSTVGKFITDAAEVYSDVRFSINTVPESAGGEQCAMRGTCDIGGVARDVKQRVLERGVHATLFAKDAIASIVHKNNPVKALTSAQLKGIFSGEIQNWSAVGGPDLAIRVLVVKASSATRKVFGDKILGDTDYGEMEVVTPDAKMIPVIARDKSAIGQLSLAFLIGQDQVSPLMVDGQVPDVNNSEYPITRPLHMVTKGEPHGAAKTFIEWALSPAGQAIVKKRFVGVR